MVGDLVTADLTFFLVVKDDAMQISVEVNLLPVEFVFKLHVNTCTFPFVFGTCLELQLNRWDSLPGFPLQFIHSLDFTHFD